MLVSRNLKYSSVYETTSIIKVNKYKTTGNWRKK